MIAVDTNVLVRIIANDDAAQSELAAATLSAADEVFIPKTVLLELEWVLRSTYRLSTDAIRSAIRQIRSLANVVIEEDTVSGRALTWYQAGMDFADSLHLASAGKERQFATFDAALQRKASQLGLRNVIHPRQGRRGSKPLRK